MIARPASESSDVFVCEACGARVESLTLPDASFRCPRFGSGDDRDHLLVPHHETRSAAGATPASGRLHPHPFIRYAHRLTAFHVARAHGLSDGDFDRVVERLDDAVAAVDGSGFVATPIVRGTPIDGALGFRAPGGVWIKDETGNVSGSHKARHLFGVMLYLRVLELIGGTRTHGRDVPLAIASCGNAALAAAVVARAADRRLTVFVPPSAPAAVMERLRALHAEPVICERRAGERGDPCYLRFHEAVDAGALAFCCQGPDHALTIEGGETIVWEMLDEPGIAPLDWLFVQVGGGALASACTRALEASAGTRPGATPRLHAVQTSGAFPLARAWARIALRTLETTLLGSVGFDTAVPAEIRCDSGQASWDALCALADARGDDPSSVERATAVDHRALQACADALRSETGASAAALVLREAAAERSAFMWPWESEPRSLAHGILDDETYDWRSVVHGMITTGGWPVVVDEPAVSKANRLAREKTGIDVDHTGSAGLAGLMTLVAGGRQDRAPAPLVSPTERVAVIFSGRRRE